MWKYFFCICVVSFSIAASNAQTLFTYGNKKVSEQEFLKAFSKNPTTGNKQAALKEYLDLYIHYKLKVQAAQAEGLQQQPSFIQEVNGFKQQIADNIINEAIGIKKLGEEALQRAQYDVEIAHIVAEISNAKDTATPYMQILAAQKALTEGKSFNEVTQQYSSNTITKQTNGYLGFITVLKLPYAVENAVYNTSVGSVTQIVKTNIGFHIFKVLNKRPAVGKRSIAQILIATPPDATADELAKAKQLADSVYLLLQKGESFKSCAARFSNDAPTAFNGGLIGTPIGIGDYEPTYEQAIFALQQPGDYSKPFATAYGYHIVQLVEKIMVNDVYTSSPQWQQTLMNSDRIAIAKNNFAPICKQLIKFKKMPYAATAVWQYTDSSLQGKSVIGSIKDSTTLFSIEKEKYTVKNWLQYINTNAKRGNNYTAWMSEFENKMALEYYTNHLEKYNQAMQLQLQEFNDANLLFAAMEKYVWTKATTDTIGLQQHYNSHKSQYIWQPSIAAIVVTCNSVQQANDAMAYLKNNGTNWQQLPNAIGSNILIDSSRFQLNQLPINQVIQNPTVGMFTTPEKSSNENLYTFLYIVQLYNKQEQRSFADARGLVVNDYQQVLEEQWIKSLKAKYPVMVNKDVFAKILAKNK
jgi:peptidyl-prolyl cis-trans isomerase SurA